MTALHQYRLAKAYVANLLSAAQSSPQYMVLQTSVTSVAPPGHSGAPLTPSSCPVALCSACIAQDTQPDAPLTGVPPVAMPQV